MKKPTKPWRMWGLYVYEGDGSWILLGAYLLHDDALSEMRRSREYYHALHLVLPVLVKPIMKRRKK